MVQKKCEADELEELGVTGKERGDRSVVGGGGAEDGWHDDGGGGGGGQAEEPGGVLGG